MWANMTNERKVNSPKEHRTPKNMTINEVVVDRERWTSLCSSTDIRRVTHGSENTNGRVSLGKLAALGKVIKVGVPPNNKLYQF